MRVQSVLLWSTCIFRKHGFLSLEEAGVIQMEKTELIRSSECHISALRFFKIYFPPHPPLRPNNLIAPRQVSHQLLRLRPCI
jgi:hypothetical protein